MTRKSRVPIVAIVGRANVGKSSFFNAAIKKREAITANEPGTTRDRLTGKVSYKGQDFWLVDTAGVKNPEDEFEATIQEQINEASESADVILMMIEADAAINDDDRRLAKSMLKTKKPVMLIVNKTDRVKNPEREYYKKFGISDISLISVTQTKGISEVLDRIVNIIPKASIKISKNRLTLAILGRPNAGKSALFNALGKKQQAIVASKAGTTRDINRSLVRYEKRQIEILDTAGIRRSGKIKRGVEQFSVMRSLAAIEEADICILLMDVNELNVQLDQKIAGMIKEAGKGLVLAVSKWDIAEGKDAYTRDLLAPQIAHDFAFVPWAPLIFTSSVTGRNVSKIFELALDIDKNRQTKIKTTQLNKWLQAISAKHPPAGLKNRTPKLHYIVGEEDNPNPTFKVYGADTKFLHWSYKRFMEKELRRAFGFLGTPIKFWFFDRK